ncbi:myosin light chain 5 [Echinops telfairi]|uniref:Myosin light chain 5 n=1 Tax=Echinops telfairi TaxID=9371 RepID=A0AC55D0Y7_ECHTE|nr:myosin light chain 5 [Echinops telfairi]
MASRKTKKKEGGALRAQRASSNVFSNFEQTQIQEFKEAFTLMDQNRMGTEPSCDRDLEEAQDQMVPHSCCCGVHTRGSCPRSRLNSRPCLWAGVDAEETILNAFKMLDPDGKGSVNKDYIKRLLMSQADKMTMEEVDQMLQFASVDAAGNLDYKALSYVITHGEEKEE